MWKVSVFGVFLVCIFLHLDWIWRDTPYLSVALRIQSECGKIGTRKTPNTYIFHAVHFISLVYFYTSWKHKKQRFSDVFGLERDHWHEIRNQVFFLVYAMVSHSLENILYSVFIMESFFSLRCYGRIGSCPFLSRDI